MSYRYWIAAIAFGLIVPAHLGEAQEKTPGEQGQIQPKQKPAQTLPIPLPVDIVEDESAAKARQRNEAEARQREIDGLAAQQGMNAAAQAMNDATQRMADYSLISTVLVGLGTALLIITLWLTRQANKAAQCAVAVTRELGIKQVRAYVFCEKVALEWGDDIIKHIVFKWKNSGLSPAKEVNVASFFSIVRPAHLVDGMSEADLEKIENRIAVQSRYSFISPGGDTKTMTSSISAEKVTQWRRGECAILAWGVIRYVDEFDEPRFSRCCYRLVYEDTPTKHVTHFERLGIGNHYE